MSRYIDAEEVEKRIDVVIGSEPRAWDKKALKELKMYIVHAVPTADVRENVRGEWINTTSGEHYKCSQCGTLAPIWIDESNSCEYDKDISEWLSDFCPNCGADMRGDKA